MYYDVLKMYYDVLFVSKDFMVFIEYWCIKCLLKEQLVMY